MIASLPRKSHDYEIVDVPEVADFVIQTLSDAINFNPFRLSANLPSAGDIAKITWDISDHPSGRYSGFYCSLPKHLFDPARHTTISYPVQFNELIEKFTFSDADMDFSFVGQMTHNVRKRIVATFGHAENSNCLAIDSGNTAWLMEYDRDHVRRTHEAKSRYADIMRQSKFIICPRGEGTGSFRLFEAMQSQRVPIIVSDQYVKPGGIDWDSFSITVPESRIADIPQLVADHMGDWETMATKARQVWQDNFSPDHIMDFIVCHLERMSPNLHGKPIQKWTHSARVGAAVARGILPRLRNRFGMRG